MLHSGFRLCISDLIPKLANASKFDLLRVRQPYRAFGTRWKTRELAQYSASTFSVSSKTHSRVNVINGCSCRRNYGRYEPDYLDATGPQIAEYEALDFQLTSYDHPVLEEFGKFVHRTAERMGFEVEDAWATPCKNLRITRLKPESTVVDAEYKLQVYERNVQLLDVPSTSLPLLIDVLQTALPAGVTLKVYPHFNIHDEIRYIPDLQLHELRKELEIRSSGGTIDKKKKLTKIH